MYYISVSWPRAKGELWQPLKYSKGDTLETVVYTLKEIRMIENQLNERNIVKKKNGVYACIYNKKSI